MGRILDRYYPATVCYYIWTATYADKTADTNIDGNDVHVTNTDENTFDDTIRGNKYLSLLIPTKFIRLQRSELPERVRASKGHAMTRSDIGNLTRLLTRYLNSPQYTQVYNCR
jgi:hypothetical protein